MYMLGLSEAFNSLLYTGLIGAVVAIIIFLLFLNIVRHLKQTRKKSKSAQVSYNKSMQESGSGHGTDSELIHDQHESIAEQFFRLVGLIIIIALVGLLGFLAVVCFLLMPAILGKGIG